MRLRGQSKHWDMWGERDPLWAVLTGPDVEGNRWDVDEFFETGRAEIAEVLRTVEASHSIGRSAALDFGCGVGRCTRHLAQHFDRAVGVDVAESMIERARTFNAEIPNVEFRVNVRPDLASFPSGSFDLVYSNIVLQHMETKHGLRYIAEFMRVLVPGGVAVFQVPTAIPPRPPGFAGIKHTLRYRLPESIVRMYDAANRAVRPTGKPAMEMHVYPVATVEAVLTAAGAAILAIENDANLLPEWGSRRFVVSSAKHSVQR